MHRECILPISLNWAIKCDGPQKTACGGVLRKKKRNFNLKLISVGCHGNFKMVYPKNEMLKSQHVGFFREPYLLQINRKLIGCEVSFLYIQ